MQELKISEENLVQKEDVDKGKNVNKCYLSLSKYYFPRNVTTVQTYIGLLTFGLLDAL